VNVSDDQSTAKFLRGLTLGALIGAVLAGSRIWHVFSRRGRKRPDR
jgi:hypothetical protein